MEADATQQIIQLLPEEYQALVGIAITVAMGAVGLYFTMILPIMNKVKSTRELLASQKENADLKSNYEKLISLNQQDMEAKLLAMESRLNTQTNVSLSVADIFNLKKSIVELELKLAFADDDEIPQIQALINEAKSTLGSNV